jgi:hypothetical protein
MEKIKTWKEINESKKHDSITFWESRFNFLRTFNGIRPKTLTTLLAKTGIGKTELTSAIIADCLKSSHVLVILTEEEADDLVKKVYKYADENEVREKLHIILSQTFTDSTQDLLQIPDMIKNYMIEFNCSICFFDNVTTFSLYDSSYVSTQSKFIEKLSKLPSEMNCSLFCVAHTKKDCPNNKILTTDDCRGSNQLPQRSHFFFTLQKFVLDNKIIQTVSVLKSRASTQTTNHFTLEYKLEKFTGDKIISSNDFTALVKLFRKESV